MLIHKPVGLLLDFEPKIFIEKLRKEEIWRLQMRIFMQQGLGCLMVRAWDKAPLSLTIRTHCPCFLRVSV
jgi:hypothetical protein